MLRLRKHKRLARDADGDSLAGPEAGAAAEAGAEDGARVEAQFNELVVAVELA